MFKVIITGCVCILLSCNNPIRDKGPGSIKWMVSTDRIGWCSPAIGPDGAIYIGDNAGVLYAIYDHDSAWSFKWEPQKIDDDIGESCPTLNGNGTRLYMGSNTRPASMYCINTEDGSVRWKYILPENNTLYGGGLVSSPALSHDEKTIYFGSGPWDSDLEVGPTTWLDDRFFALEDMGDSCVVKWMFKPEHPTDAIRFSFFGNPAVDKDGSIYIGTFGGYLYKLRDAGDQCQVLWKHAFKRRVNTSPTVYQEVWGSPTLGPDGTVYIATNDWRLHAFTSGGVKKWHFETGGETWTTPVIANNGLLIFGSEDGYIYGIRDEGDSAREIWRFPENSTETWWGTAAVAEDGTVIFGSEATKSRETGIYYAIDENNGNLKWKTPSLGLEARTHPAIGDDGTIYVSGGEGKNFFAIRGTAALAGSFWPKMQNNNSNSGKTKTKTHETIQPG
jgi:outer membrane protein assembly factor BamB